MKKSDLYIDKVRLKNQNHKDLEILNINKKYNEEFKYLYDKEKSFKNNVKINLKNVNNNDFNKSFSNKNYNKNNRS